MDIIIDGNIQPSDGFMIGATTSQTLDFTLINKGDIVYGTSTIKVEIGLKIGSTIEYIPLGIYNIDDIEKTDYTIKITAFDNMIKFETPYFSNLGDTPTLQQVVNELSSKTGVQFVGSLPAYNVKKLEGFTCREILGYVASLCGGNAVITRDGKFTIVTPKDNSYSIGTANYIDYKREETKYKIGKVSCQAGEEVLSKGSLGADSMELQFENPWITNSILTDIYNKLNGFEYLGYSMKWQGDISLDVGDIVTITDKKGVVRKHPILSQKFTYTGGLTSEISAKGENKNKNEFSSSGPSAKKVERVVMELALINKALIDVAYIGDLTANNIKFDTASGGTLDLQSLLVKFVSGENGQYLNLTSSNVVIDNAVIKDLIAPNISVGDLKAGNIDSNRFNIVGSSGNLLIKDNTIQIKDSNRTRVQIGKDASNDYNMYVWDSTGKLMFDATGLKADGIKSKIIRDDMVSDTANINGSKINISSLITEVNKDTNTQVIKASKIAFDSTGQSLEVSFNSLKSNVDNIEVGGRNLIKSSNFIVQATKESFASTTQSFSIVNDLDLNAMFLGKTVIFSYFVHCPGDRENRTSSGSLGNRFGIHGIVTWKDSTGVKANTTIYPFAEALTGSYINKRVAMSYTFNPPTGYDQIVSVSFSFQPLAKPAVTNNEIWKIGQPKLEIGTKVTDYTVAHEDTDKKIETNTTSINAINGQIDTLIKDTTIEENGTTVKLKDSYSSLKQTVSGINSTVASHTTSITNLGTNVTNAQNTANNANTLADSKAKVFTSTPTTPYKTGDIWAGGPSGEIMKCKVARASGSYVASDWEKASKYTDDTKANAVDGKVTTLSGTVTTINNKQATLEQSLDGFKTTVSDTYSTKTELSNLSGTVSSINSRVSTAESSITQLNNSIKLKVEQTDITNAVDGIEIGGKNYLRNSNFEKGVTNWGGSHSATLSIPSNEDQAVSTCPFKNGNVAKLTQKNGQIYAFISQDSINLFSLEIGEIYTFSGLVYADNSIPVSNMKVGKFDITTAGWFNGVTKEINERNKWINFKFTFKATSTRVVIVAGLNGTSNSVSYIVYGAGFKLEKGNKATDWTPAPEDVDSSINAVDSKVETVKNNVSQLTVDLNGITGRVSSTESTISTHTTQLGTVDSRINTAKTSAINTASTDATTKANNAKSGAVADAKSYTDGQITTVNSTINTKVAEIKATTDSITSRVASTESSISTINGNVSSITTRVNTVEQNITATAITTTISSAINAGTSSISTTQFIMDKNGLAIKNGALTIKNKAGATVLSSDTNGNLTVTGTITGSKIVGSDITGGTINGSTIISEGLVNKRELFIEASGGYSPQITFRPLIKNQDGTGTLKNKAYLYASASGLHIQAVEDGDIIIEANRLLFFGGYSINTNGYSKLPNGLILQWGITNVQFQNGNISTISTVQYPIVFPSNVVYVGTEATQISPSGIPLAKITTGNSDCRTNLFNIQAFSIAGELQHTLAVKWVALGY